MWTSANSKLKLTTTTGTPNVQIRSDNYGKTEWAGGTLMGSKVIKLNDYYVYNSAKKTHIVAHGNCNSFPYDELRYHF